VIRDPRFHRGTDAQSLLNPAEIVMHKVKGYLIGVVLDFL